MNYREITLYNPDYNHLRCVGQWTVETSRNCWQVEAAMLQHLNHGKLLIDPREIELETSNNIDFEHAGFVADLMRGLCSRATIIGVPEHSEANQYPGGGRDNAHRRSDCDPSSLSIPNSGNMHRFRSSARLTQVVPDGDKARLVV